MHWNAKLVHGPRPVGHNRKSSNRKRCYKGRLTQRPEGQPAPILLSVCPDVQVRQVHSVLKLSQLVSEHCIGVAGQRGSQPAGRHAMPSVPASWAPCHAVRAGQPASWALTARLLSEAWQRQRAAMHERTH